MRALGTCLLILALIVGASGCKRRGAAATDAKDDRGSTPAGPDTRAGKTGNGTFTVGPATTHATEPLDGDGLVDYPAALNARLGRGATPANNANVLLVKALGPRPEGRAMPPGYYSLLGITAPPEQGAYFVGTQQYKARAPGFDDQLSRAGQLPWTTQQYPQVAEWLKANDEPLALIVEATTRTHYFNPLLPDNKDGHSTGLLGAPLLTVQSLRLAASALAARGMLWAGHGEPDRAWQDLLALHRLARLVGRGGMMIEGMVGCAVEANACKADLALLDRGRLDGKRIGLFLADLRDLPPTPDPAAAVDLGERFMFLDTVMNLYRQGPGFLTRVGGGGGAGAGPLAGVSLADVDWDPAFEAANRVFDRIGALRREKDRAARVRAWAAVDADIRAAKARADGGGLAAARTPKDKGQAIGDVLIGLMMPAAGKVLDAADRTRQAQDNVQTAFALAQYQRATGRFPPTLDALAPDYLPHAPLDLFTGRPLVYRPGPAGYLLYSVGINGTDDGGRGYDSTPQGDDLYVQMPVPERR